MDTDRSQISIPERAILADQLKCRLRRIQGARVNREGSRHSDARWRAKLGQSFQVLREICCPYVEERSSGKNARRQILEESMKHIQHLEHQITQAYGPENLEHFRERFQMLEQSFLETQTEKPRSTKKVRTARKSVNERDDEITSFCSVTVVKTEEASPVATGQIETTFVSGSQATYGCSQSELDRLEELLNKTPDKADLVDTKCSGAPVKWSSIKGRIKCRRKLDMVSVADYLETSDELHKENEPESIEKLSQLSGDDVLDYFENSSHSVPQNQVSGCEGSSPSKNSSSFEFVDEKVVRDFLKKQGGLTDYTPSQE